jgi:hypothetical protein
MKESYTLTLLQLRLLVGFLGERAQYAWWPTAFYQTSSRPFLEPCFSKTYRLAQYHGVLEAARHLHDEHLNVGCYHLFRLPEEIEQDLHKYLMISSADEELANPMLQNKDDALNTLKQMAISTHNSSIGPVAVGNIREIDTTDTLNALATAYFLAFSRNTKAYPYLAG